MRNTASGPLVILFLIANELLLAQDLQKAVLPAVKIEKEASVGVYNHSLMIAELEDILLMQGCGAATARLQSVINVVDGLRDGVSTKKNKKAIKAVVVKGGAAVAESPKIDGVDQEAMSGFLQKYAQVLTSYVQQGEVVATTALFDQGVQCLVDIVRTPLLSEKGKDSVVKTIFPKVRVRVLDAKEVAAWLAIRPMFAPYQQKDGDVEYLHPLQDAAVKALQSALVQCKTKQVHYCTARRLQEAVEMFVGTVLLRRQQVPVLTKIASLEQLQQLAAAIAENEVLSADIKVMAKTAIETLIGVLSNLRAATTMVTSQLAADQSAPLLAKITNAMGYMNKCDALIKGLNVSSDVYADDGMQKLRNAFAQNLVELQKKVVPEVTAQFVSLLQRAVETGLLGKAQRAYVLNTMLPAFDSEVVKKTREAAMKRLGKSVVKRKAKK